ncbi:hypothetical protein DVH24_018583 [Malus domestica]|uniref:Uncharacterized protein n=1 Tax=Malus domestica TaxID=3750 RepID=A0A498HI87_MALDO|nr:hypothetical protein DVH24_018583 [Malus domestica]
MGEEDTHEMMENTVMDSLQLRCSLWQVSVRLYYLICMKLIRWNNLQPTRLFSPSTRLLRLKLPSPMRANTRCTWFTQIGYIHGVEEFSLIVKGLHKYIDSSSHLLLMRRALIEAVVLVRVVLWVLGTKLGTLLLGSLCFGNTWPFVHKFSSLSLEKREKVLQKWFRHRFLTPIRLAFTYIKFLCLYIFFSRVIFHFLSLSKLHICYK